MTTVAIVLAIAKRKSSRTMNEETTHEEFQIDRSARISTLVFRWFNTSAAIIVGAIAWGVWASILLLDHPDMERQNFCCPTYANVRTAFTPTHSFLGSKKISSCIVEYRLCSHCLVYEFHSLFACTSVCEGPIDGSGDNELDLVVPVCSL